MWELETWIAEAEARTLPDAGGKLRRLAVMLQDRPGAQALATSALKVVEGVAVA